MALYRNSRGIEIAVANGLKTETVEGKSVVAINVGENLSVNEEDQLNAEENQGPPGEDGATWTATASIPTGGENGDLHLKTDDSDVYKNVAAVWGVIANIKGATGTDGEDGTDGATWTTGIAVPTGGNPNDLYFKTDTSDVYKNVAGVWGIIANIEGGAGEAGVDGATWTATSSVPTGGNPNDLHLKTDNGDVYKNVAAVWGVIANIKGATGATGAAGATATTAAIDLYVNAATGNDTTGDGTLALPYATIAKAKSLVPLVIKHAVTIHVYAGTYAETIFDGSIYSGNSGSLTIQGEDFTTPTLGSGSITSGTLGTLSGTSRTVAGAAWTTNELRGMLIKITSGSFNGRYYPICGNTATAIEIGHMSTTPNGATFSIVQPAVIITRTTGVNYSAYIVNNGNVGNGLMIKRCALQPGASQTGMYVSAGAGGLSECVVTVANKGVVMNGPNTVLEVWASYVTATSSCAEILQGGAFYTPASCFHGSTVAILVSTLGYWGLAGSAIGATVWVQSATTGITVSGSCVFNWVNATRSQIRSHTTAFKIDGCARGTISNTDVTACTATGVAFDQGSGTYASGHSNLFLSSFKIQTCVRGMRFSSSHNTVYFNNSSDISGNITAGIIFSTAATSPANAFNQVQFSTNTTTSGNTAGDISLDGTTFDSLANLRLDADKTFVDSVKFNRAIAD